MKWKSLSDTELFFSFYNIALTHTFKNGKFETQRCWRTCPGGLIQVRPWKLIVVQRPRIILITVSTHTGLKLRVWFALEPSNTQYKGCGIKDISEGVDPVSNDCFLHGSGGQGSPPRLRNLPNGKSPGARLANFCNTLLGVATSFLKGLPTTAGNSWLRYWCHAEAFSVLLGFGAPQMWQLVSGTTNSALLAESQTHVTVHTDIVCYYCPT